jgi:hypothetical protein
MGFKEAGIATRFKPGQSGNPSGQPKAIISVVTAARQHTAAAIQTLFDIMSQKSATATARVMAAREILDRGWGKALQNVSILNNERQLTDADIHRLIFEQRPELGDTSAGAVPAPPDKNQLN